jgi:hypothetical protein
VPCGPDEAFEARSLDSGPRNPKKKSAAGRSALRPSATVAGMPKPERASGHWFFAQFQPNPRCSKITGGVGATAGAVGVGWLAGHRGDAMAVDWQRHTIFANTSAILAAGFALALVVFSVAFAIVATRRWSRR